MFCKTSFTYGGLCGAAGRSGAAMRRTLKGDDQRADGFFRAIPDPGGALRDE